jgi:membrane protein YqaA with SNARE-associated domain
LTDDAVIERDFLEDDAEPEIAPQTLTDPRTRIIALTVVGAFIALGAILLSTGNLSTDSVGYPSIWLISFVGASAIVLPVPGMAAMCLAASPGVGLNPLAVGLVAACAEALGELTGYIAGASGAAFLQNNRWYPRFRNWLIRRGWIALFLLATIPNPVFDLIGIAAGALGYPVKRFLVIIMVGKSIKSVGIAYACYFGVSMIEDLIDTAF